MPTKSEVQFSENEKSKSQNCPAHGHLAYRMTAWLTLVKRYTTTAATTMTLKLAVIDDCADAENKKLSRWWDSAKCELSDAEIILPPKCKTTFSIYHWSSSVEFEITCGSGMQVAKTPSYPVMSRFALIVTLCDHNPPTLPTDGIAWALTISEQQREGTLKMRECMKMDEWKIQDR